MTGVQTCALPISVHGIYANVAIYLPMTVLMARTKYTGHLREGFVLRARITALGAVKVFRAISKDHVTVAMIALAGLGAFFIGAAIQTAMPDIAGTGRTYTVLLFANGLGGVIGGLMLEGTGWLKPSVRTAIWSTAVYGGSTALFALCHNYIAAAFLLVVGGVAALANMSITQTVVQLRAPRKERGQVIGVYGVSANGLRMGSGVTVGFLGAIAGLRWSLGLSAMALCACTALVAIWVALSARGERADQPS